jgi:molybdate transport system permease protein
MSDAALSAMWMSLQLATLTVLIATPLSITLAWWMARVTWRGKVLLDAFILLPLGLPPAVIGFWLMTGLGEQGALGRWLRQDLGLAVALYPTGAVLAACIMTVPMMARMLRPVFEAHDPMLLPVARTLGASNWYAWRTVALPLTLPAIGSAMALGFAAAWGESGAVLVLAAGQPGGTARAEDPTVPLALWQAMASPSRPQALAWEVAALSLGVAAIAILLSELLRWQWQNRWQGSARMNWRSERP